MRSFYRRSFVAFLSLSLMCCTADPDSDEAYYTPSLVRQLIDINTPESLMMASMMVDLEWVRQNDPSIELPSADALHQEALRLAPNDEMVVSLMGRHCEASAPQSDPVVCNAEWAEKLRDLNPDNGFYWASLAHYQLAGGNQDAALESYRRASSAPHFYIGWGAYIYRLSMALDEVLPLEQTYSVAFIVGALATHLPAFQDFTKTCRAKVDDPRWQKACLELGESMEKNAQTLIARTMGFPLQRIAYEAVDDDEGLSAVNARKEAFKTIVQLQNDSYECRSEDPEWIDEWLESMRDYDEMETMRRMSEVEAGC